MPIYVICDYNIHKTDLADLSNFKEIWEFSRQISNQGIREIPDHATFREKENTLGRLDKLGVFLSLALCN